MAAVPVTLCVFVLLRTSSGRLVAGVHPVDSFTCISLLNIFCTLAS